MTVLSHSRRNSARAEGRARPAAESAALRRFGILTPVLFALLLVFGGGGAPHAIMLVPLQVIGLAGLLGLAYLHLFVQPVRLPAWPAGLIVIGGLILAGLQLTPLPYEVWTSLPGRELAQAITLEAGLEGIWHPWSLAPEYTRSALLTVLPALATFLAVSASDAAHRLQLAKIVLLAALLSAAVGFVQLVTGGAGWTYLSPRAVEGAVSGLFANRNFQATFLLIGILACSAVIRIAKLRRDKTRVRTGAWLLIALLALMVVATQSRFGFAMLAAVLLIISTELEVWRSVRASLRQVRPSFATLVTIGGAVLALGAMTVALGGRLLVPVLQRFGVGSADAVGEMRIDAIPDLLRAAERFFPLGAGLGTFDPVYRGVESLQLVSDVYFNHAHNDYAELMIEAGLPGLALVLLFVVAFAVRAAAILRDRSTSEEQVLRRMAVVAVALLLVHSLVDYPLRTVTLQCVFAYLAALIFVPQAAMAPARSGPTPSTQRRPASRSAVAIALVLAGVLGSVVIARIGLARQAVGANSGVLAAQLRPQHPRAAALAADALLQAGDARGAAVQARAALSAFPIDAVGVRVLGEARNQLQPGSGDALLRLASLTGWRDRPTQSWTVERGLVAGDYRVAALRAEALARLRSNPSATYAFLRILTLQPDARELIVRALASRPPWRAEFLTNDDPKTAAQLASMAQVLRDLQAANSPPSLSEARPIIDALLNTGKPAEAFALYRTLLPGRVRTSGNLLTDGGFTMAPAAYQPGPANTAFDWRVWEAGNSFAEIEPVLGERGNNALFVAGTRGEQGRLAERVLGLAPGRYTLRYRIRAESDEGGEGLRWLLRCAGPQGTVLTQSELGNVSAEGWQRMALRFTVPATGCPVQVLTLAVQDVPLGSNPSVIVDDLDLRAER